MNLLAIISLLIALPNGSLPAYAREPGYLAARVADTEHAARVAGVDVALLSALITHESGWNRDAVSWNGTSAGIAQIRVGGPLWTKWQTACAATPATCQYAAINIAARYLHHAIVKCKGAYRCAVAFYRFGHVVKPRLIDTRVVVTARWIRRRLAANPKAGA